MDRVFQSEQGIKGKAIETGIILLICGHKKLLFEKSNVKVIDENSIRCAKNLQMPLSLRPYNNR